MSGATAAIARSRRVPFLVLAPRCHSRDGVALSPTQVMTSLCPQTEEYGGAEAEDDVNLVELDAAVGVGCSLSIARLTRHAEISSKKQKKRGIAF